MVLTDRSWPTKFAQKGRRTLATMPTLCEYVDMFKAGIIDPVKVVRTALSNAASIAGLLLTTEALVTTFDKEDKEKQRVEGSVR